MPCFKPLSAYVGAGRSKNGKRNIVWKESEAISGEVLKLPCGQCIGCRLARSCESAIRCVHEASFHEANCFVTLTYDDEHLPSSKSLVRSDPQIFLRSLRKRLAPKRIRFFGCGEYGEARGRPHYHLCLFGEDFAEDREVIGRSVDGESDLFSSELLSETWGKGFASFGSLTFESAAYVARYSLKKLNGSLAERADSESGLTHYQGVDSESGEVVQRIPEFSMWSLKPGIGVGWLERYWSDAFPSDFLVHEGRKLPVPKLYRRYLEQVDSVLAGELADRRAEAGLARESDRTPERLAVRELCAELRVKRGGERALSLGRRQVVS